MRGFALVTLALAAGCAAEPPDIRSTITQEAIAATTEPLLFVELTETGQEAIMALTGRNGDVVTWSTTDGRSISLHDGVLVATRGFGFDLMSADVSGTLNALNRGAREYERFASYLNGENRTVMRGFACVISGPEAETVNSFGRSIEVSRWIEECSSLEEQVRSVFRLVDGEMLSSVQLVSGPVGHILTERLSD